MYELLLISVAIAGGYWGQFFLRTKPHGTATFGQMQLASAVLALLGVVASRGAAGSMTSAFGVAGAIGLGMGACLLVVGPMVRSAARRFAVSEHLGIAKRLLDVAEILNPGSGVAEEKALLGAMKEIREGRVEQTIDALTAARDRVPPEARLAIDERIAMLYLAAYRWTDAIAHAETHLFAASPESPESPESGESPQVSLRIALGIAPPVWVELLAAYGRIGDLDRAATMLVRLEDACCGRADAGVWVHRARMMFLALAGRPTAVQALVAPRTSRHMSIAARAYWLAVAHEHAGDRASATAAYAKARSRSRGKPREMIDRAVAGLGDAKVAKPSDAANDIIARVEAAPIPETPRVERQRSAWATPITAIVILATAGAIASFLGSATDVGVLVRAGAMVRGLIDDGEWWRLVACIFIHVGAIHLLVNTLGLWFVGRLAEEIFGGSRTITIFACAGLAGSIASYLASPAGISAGASGAVFGLLGAVFAELTLHRRHYRAAWKRGMWGSLGIVTLAQIGVDFMYPMVDQWAHGAGLLAGGLFGLLLSPRAKWARVGLHAARSIAIVFGLAAAFGAVMVVRTTLAVSLTAQPSIARRIGDLTVAVPTNWLADASGVSDPDGLIVLSATRIASPDGAPKAIAAWIAAEPARAKRRNFDQTETVAPADHLVTLPTGWEGVELVASFPDSMDYRQRFRVIVCGRTFGTVVVVANLYVPEAVARDIPGYLAQTLATLGPAD